MKLVNICLMIFESGLKNMLNVLDKMRSEFTLLAIKRETTRNRDNNM